jgi:translation initiation factor 2 alpha subunit (eIF-2alpha)
VRSVQIYFLIRDRHIESICAKNLQVFFNVIAAPEVSIMISDQDQQRAEKRFKQKERARDGRKAITEYETQARATRAKTERLKALRLAKEAQEPPVKQAKRRDK